MIKVFMHFFVLVIVILLTLLSSYNFGYMLYNNLPVINYIIGLLSIGLCYFCIKKYKNHKQQFVFLCIGYSIVFIFFYTIFNMDKGFLPTACLNILLSLSYVIEYAHKIN